MPKTAQLFLTIRRGCGKRRKLCWKNGPRRCLGLGQRSGIRRCDRRPGVLDGSRRRDRRCLRAGRGIDHALVVLLPAHADEGVWRHFATATLPREDMARRLPDVSKLERAIGFRPRRPLSEIIADVVAEKRALMGVSA